MKRNDVEGLLSRATVLEIICQLCEAEPARWSYGNLEERLGEKTMSSLLDTGLLYLTNCGDEVRLDWDEGPVWQEIMDRKGDVVRCFNPDGELVWVDKQHACDCQLNLQAFSSQLAHLLGMMPSFQAQEILEGKLWGIGRPRLGQSTSVPVYLARRLSNPETRELVSRELTARGDRDVGILLLTGENPFEHKDRLSGHICVPLMDGVQDGILRPDRLGRLAGYVPEVPEAGDQSGPLVEPDGKWVIVRGKKEDVDGRNRQQLVRYIHEHRNANEGWVLVRDALRAAGYTRTAPSSAFSGVKPEKICMFKFDESKKHIRLVASWA